jgi:hypothetical protein
MPSHNYTITKFIIIQLVIAAMVFYLKSESSNNSVFNNTIRNVNGSALLLNDGASDNSVYSNIIVNPPSEEEVINNEDQDNNTFEDNNILSCSAFSFAPSSPFSSFHVYSMAREN